MKLSVEQEWQAVLCVIFGRQVAMLFIGVRRPALSRVVNPTHDVIIVRFLANLGQVRGKGAADLAAFFADRVTGQTTARLEQILAVVLFTVLFRRDFAVETALPETASHPSHIFAP